MGTDLRNIRNVKDRACNSGSIRDIVSKRGSDRENGDSGMRGNMPGVSNGMSSVRNTSVIKDSSSESDDSEDHKGSMHGISGSLSDDRGTSGVGDANGDGGELRGGIPCISDDTSSVSNTSVIICGSRTVVSVMTREAKCLASQVA